MDLSDVKKRIRLIEDAANAGDDEEAHAQEDSLHQDVLSAIAQGEVAHGLNEEIAKLALSSLDIDFSRWYA